MGFIQPNLLESTEDRVLPLLQERELVVNILDHMRLGVVATDNRGRVSYANMAFLELGSYRKKEVRGKLLGSLLQGWSPTDSIHGGDEPLRCRLVARAGKLIPVEVNTYPLRRSGEQATGGICLVYDVAEKEEYRSLEQAAGFILESIQSGVIVVDRELRVTRMNLEAERLTGAAKENVIGRHIDEVFADAPEEHRFISKTLAEGKEIRGFRYWTTVVGRPVQLMADSSLVRAEDGEVLGVVFVFRDVTVEARLEEEMRSAERLSTLSQMAAGVAHEIRNPLTSARGFVEILRGRLEGAGLSRELRLADVILQEMDRIAGLVADFVHLARTGPLRFQSVDLNAVVEMAAGTLSRDLQNFGITLSYQLDPAQPKVSGDRPRLRQLVTNLLLNAIEAMGSRGQITVETKLVAERNQALLKVRDSGEGIRSEVLNRVFDPFFSTKEGRRGLGLSISRSIVVDHGGEISLESEPGEGTTVYVWLPLP